MTLPLLQNSKNSDVNAARMVALSNQYSTKSGSSLLLNLAVCLRNLGKSVCVFDSTSARNLLEYKPETPLPGTAELVEGFALIDELMLRGPEGVDIIPHTNGIAEYSLLDANQKQNLLFAFTQLQHDYDFVLIDSAAGINLSTLCLLLGAGAIVITITPDASSLNSAFRLLKEIKQRLFQQPVKVIVNLVAGENEAKQIIARLSVAIRNYLGTQCGGMSFFIFDLPMLDIMSSSPLVSVDHPNSAPSQCLNNIVLRITESGHPQSMMLSSQLTDLQTGAKTDYDLTNDPGNAEDNEWVVYAMNSLLNEPPEVIDPIMRRLNEVWNERKLLQTRNPSEHPVSAIELDILNLKTAIHFASQINGKKAL